MEKMLKKKKWSNVFLMLLGLMAFALDATIGGGIATLGLAMAVAVKPAGGGVVRTDAMTTAEQAKADSERLLLDTIDEKVTKVRPYDVVLDTIARNIKDVKTSNNMVIRHYAIDSIDLTAKLTTAYNGGDSQAELSTSNDGIFASCGTVIVNGVKGYKIDGTTRETDVDLILYIVGKSSADKILVTAVNGSGANKDVIPAIPANTLLTRAGRAGGETQIQTDAYSGVPTDTTQYLQKFMAQVEMSELYKRADKEVDWDFSDLDEEVIFNFRREQNVSFWKSVPRLIKKKNPYLKKAEDTYLTGGIWWQAGKDFSFGGSPIDAQNLVSLMKHCFTGNSAGQTKLMITGSDVLEQLEQVPYDRQVKVGEKKKAHGLEFNSIISKFGTLLVVHDKSFDEMLMSRNFFILDPDLLRKWTMGWRVNDFDFRKSGQADADARGLIEPCGLVLKNPMAHSRGSLD